MVDDLDDNLASLLHQELAIAPGEVGRCPHGRDVLLPLRARRRQDTEAHCPNRGCIMTVPSTPDQNSTVRYDPFTAVPKTFGEMRTWHACRMSHERHPARCPLPIDIESDADARYILVFLRENFPEYEITTCVVWRRLTDRYWSATGKCDQEIDAIGLSAMVSFLRGGREHDGSKLTQQEKQAKDDSKRGRKRLSEQRLADYDQLKERWERAKDAGVSKPHFCEDAMVSQEALDTALSTLRKKKRKR
jgi:hypothetical protein